ncbi:bifunctional metallophosphatase/5'-nucleotidase [Ruminococcaceae bacterium OttesenSCG-928-N02]|nr:bifunctional metallophosphatase/5'-nucleotidase [Ruminococcaceae bacterium OttesenSCG-928-N02]
MDRHLTIYLTSDTHGYLFPTDYASTGDAPQGLLKIIEAFTPGPNTLVMDAGDTLQGSPFTLFLQGQATPCAGPHPVASVLNLGGYQYITLGNHDFNYGVAYLANYLNSLNARCLCANIRALDGSLPVQASAIATLENGLRVGIVGVCTDHVRVWEKPQTTAELIITDPFEAARAELELLRGKTDLNICLYHGGYEIDLQTGLPLTASTENVAGRISHELDFDLLLTGHQHMPLAGVSFGGTHGVQPPANAVGFCKVEITVTAGGQKHFESEILPPAATPHAQGYAELLPLEQQVQTWLDRPIGTLSRALPCEDRLDMALHGSLIANFINQVQLQATGAQISAVGLANSIKGFSQQATVRDVVATYVFANTLSVLEISGAVLRQYVERCAEYFTLGEGGTPTISDEFSKPKLAHYNYDFFSGIHYTIDLNKPVGERVVSLTFAGEEVQASQSYTVCMNNYRTTGTGGFEFLTACPKVREFGTEVSELLIAYIEEASTTIPVDETQYLTVLY